MTRIAKPGGGYLTVEERRPTMSDYISRDCALGGIDKAFRAYEEHGDILRLFSDVRSVVICAPAADVRPVVRGEWVPAASYNDGVINTAYCSACHDYLPPGEADNWPFCPNCGADMSQKGGSNE